MWKDVTRRIRAMFRREQLESELDEEMRFHLEKEIEQNLARGMSASAARAAARRSFGSVEVFKEEARDVRGVRVLEETVQDVRYGLRMLRKAPGFTAVAVISLALGIGANTAFFSVVDSVLLRKLPVQDPDRLVLLEWEAGRNFRNSGTNGYGAGDDLPGRRSSSSFHYKLFQELQSADGPLSDVFGFADVWDANTVAEGVAEKNTGQWVTGNYFGALGLRPVIGRLIEPSDDQPSAAPVAVLNYDYWRDRFHFDQDVLGKQLVVNKVSFTIVGVAPPNFRGTLQVDSTPTFNLPLAFEPVMDTERPMLVDKTDEPAPWFLHIMGRLKPGASQDDVFGALNGGFQRLALEIMPAPRRESEKAQIDPQDYPNLRVKPGNQGMTETRRIYKKTIYLVFGVVGLVLLIACANVANMLLARATVRSPEISLRLAIGAGRLRLVRQLLTESVLLSLVGGALGVMLAFWGTRLLMTMADLGGRFLPSDVDYAMSWRVLAFTLGVSLATGILFGIAPAWRASRVDLTGSLKEGGRRSSAVGHSRLSKALVIAQVASSLVLLVAAGLFVRTVQNLANVDVGFDKQNLLVFRVQPGLAGYKDARLEEFVRQTTARLEAIPGVQAVTFGHIPPIANYVNDTNVILPGETATSADEHDTNRQIIRENYFDALGIHVLAGRAFTSRDDADAPKVVVVTEAFVKKFLPNVDPVGQKIGFDEDTTGKIEIVGVVSDTKYSDVRTEIQPIAYTPWRQELENFGHQVYMVRSTDDPGKLEALIHDVVRDVDPTVPVTDVATQEAQVERTFGEERTLADLLSFFGGLALLLAGIGLYGIMAYSVAQRTNEIGIRMALGAREVSVLKLVISQGMRVALVGLIVGSVLALGLKQIVASQLYGVGPADPMVFGVVGLVLVAAAALACWIPARRATKVDPVVALRSE